MSRAHAARWAGLASLALVLFAGSGPRAPLHAQARTVRDYFVAAEEVTWDFAPSGRNLVMDHGGRGGRLPEPWARTHRWKKVRYVEYTDDTFATPKPQPAWLGILGPVIRAEVGDTVRVHFLNRARGRYGMHPHGLRYTKDHEGAHYGDSGAGARVPPGDRFVYEWIADEGSGPGPADPSSIVWWYHSHVDEPAETNAGLLGPIVVTRRGAARPDATPADVDREIVLLFMIFDEAKGAERGMMHSINGYIFGNLPAPALQAGERVRWYVLGMGNEKDIHTAHWHGKTLRASGRHTDVLEVFPGSMVTADMTADNPGTWLLHCHVADHLNAGMLALYTIR
ncbi:MAG TPA: multicopper oxidase domain-containing protein [Candidatus Binatia bacterium]|nr:multicopper oxidase domain-containing protein [Candidatus Binatia bacterium]